MAGPTYQPPVRHSNADTPLQNAPKYLQMSVHIQWVYQISTDINMQKKTIWHWVLVLETV
jgi:hypothetical protein